MKGKPVIRRGGPRLSRDAASQIALGAVAAGGFLLLARAIELERPTAFDLAVRRVARSAAGQQLGRAMNPLFPIGLPGGYITIAYLVARRLRARRRRGGPAIVTSAWLGWLVHSIIKEFYFRRRPPCGRKPDRSDSYPSGHTTGATALATTTALVLGRQGLVSPASARAIGVVPPAVMGAFRVLADDHWATDVLGGWMLGAAIGLTCDAVLGQTGGAARELTAPGSTRRPRRRPRHSGRPSYAA